MNTFTLNNLRFLNDIGDIEQFSLNEKNILTTDGQSNNQDHINNSSSDLFKNKNNSQDSNNSTSSSSSIEVEFDENIDVLNELEPSEPSSFRTMDYSENLNDLDHPYLSVYTINTKENNIINQAEIIKNDEFFELDLEKTNFNTRTDRPKSALKRLHTPKSLNRGDDNSKLKYNENIADKKEKTIKKVNDMITNEKKTVLNHSFWSSIEKDILINNDSSQNKTKEHNKNLKFEKEDEDEDEKNVLKKNDGKLQNFKVYDISEIGINNSREKEFFFNEEDSFNKNDEDLYDNIDEELFEKIDEESFDKNEEESLDKIEEESFDKLEEEFYENNETDFDKNDKETFKEVQSPSEENLSNNNDEQEIKFKKNNFFMNTKKALVEQTNEELSFEKQESQGLTFEKKVEIEKDYLTNLDLINELKKEFEKSIFENLNFNYLEKQIKEIKELIKNKDLEDSKVRKTNLIDHDFVKEELSKIEKVQSNNLQKIEKKLENLELSFKIELESLNKKKIKQFDDLYEIINKKIDEKENDKELKSIEKLIKNLKDEIIYKKNDKVLNGDMFENKLNVINLEITEIKKNENEIKEIIKRIDEKISLFLSENNLHKEKFTENQSKNVLLNNDSLNKTNINLIENISTYNSSLSLINEKLGLIQNTLKEINCSQNLVKTNKLEDVEFIENSNKTYQKEILENDLVKSNQYDLNSSFKINNFDTDDCNIFELAYNVRKNIRLFRSNFLRQKFLTLSSIMDNKTCLENLNLDDKKQNTNVSKNQNLFENDDNKLRISIKEAGKNLKEDVKQLKNLGNFDFSTNHNVCLTDNFRLKKIQLLRQEIDSKLRKLNQVIIN